MQVEVKVPQLSESVSEATLVSWHKKEGEAVKRDENLIDIETDKVVMELPAPADGVLVKIIKGDKGTVGSGEVIAMIDTTAKATASAAPAAAPEAAPAKAASAPAAAAAPAMSPAAAKIVAEANLNAGDIAGSGRGGRITKEDAVAKATGAPAPAAAPAAAKPASAPVQMPVGDRPEQRVPMSRLRARIAERLLQSSPRSTK
jgi:2-oxoglutarate dehydrogenase E2 component (dihydrolipoamide succinyltransferase)